MSATTTKLLSSGEFCKLCYDTIPVKSASANVSFYTNISKMPNFELWHLSQISDMLSSWRRKPLVKPTKPLITALLQRTSKAVRSTVFGPASPALT